MVKPRGTWSAALWAATALLMPLSAAADEPDPAPSAEVESAAQGVVVTVSDLGALPQARALARSVYQDLLLRPRIDEAVARALLPRAAERNEPPPSEEAGGAPIDPTANEVRTAVDAALASADPSVQKRLWRSVGRDLNAALVVVVASVGEGAEQSAEARVLRVASGEVSSVRLHPSNSLGSGGMDWGDAVVVLRGLMPTKASVPSPDPPPKPAPVPLATPPPAPLPLEDEGMPEWLTSPWFWSGIGVVVAAGVTVLVLSQTLDSDPSSVHLQGSIAP